MRRGILIIALFAAAALVAAVAAFAADYRPPPVGEEGPEVTYSTVLGKASNMCVGGQKLDGEDGDLVDGTYPFYFDGYLGSITLDVKDTDDGKVFDFVTDLPNDHFVTGIWVKGGPFGSAYYNYLGGGLTDVGADDGLHSLYNENSGKWYGLSHICVLTDKK